MKNKILDGVMGLCVGDAIGVPVEFVSRETLIKNPVINMRSYGTYNQPAGTWSDDTSMTLCLVDSLIKGLDYQDIMTNFHKWFDKGEFTPYGETFDVGNSTRKAITRYSDGVPSLECGGLTEYDNGNGSLMRILPILFYLQSIYGTEFPEDDEAFDIIHNVSALTHAHTRSKIACGIYVSVASELIGRENLKIAVGQGIYRAELYYKKQIKYKDELKYFNRLKEKDFEKLDETNIKSSGYVVDTLEAAIWCLLNTNNYKDCILKAVNLGEDTDTVAAVAGGLAGMYYGYENIPNEWLAKIARREYIEDLCSQLNSAVNKMGIDKLCSYIPYFETATVGEKQYNMPYPDYDRTLVQFIDDVYKTTLMTNNYLDIIKSRGINGEREMSAAIDTADLELVQAILTGYVRQERFCDGLWASAVEDKVFLKILKRLQQL
ncbi:MAG: ADP-ribosylglycohydrolase family protein [Vulcanibacillus sp.]